MSTIITDNPYTFTVSDNMNISAVFEDDGISLTRIKSFPGYYSNKCTMYDLYIQTSSGTNKLKLATLSESYSSAAGGYHYTWTLNQTLPYIINPSNDYYQICGVITKSGVISAQSLWVGLDGETKEKNKIGYIQYYNGRWTPFVLSNDYKGHTIQLNNY